MLEVRGLGVRYGQTAALHDVDLEIADGEFVALLGSNGAGKSSLFRALSGLLAPSAGTIRFADRHVGKLRADAVVRLGIAHCPEGRHLFPALSVEKNLVLGGYLHRRDKRGVASELERVCALFPILAEKRAVPAGALSGGQQQMVAIGRALMARPKLLLLDEPTLGLAPLVVQQLFEAIAAINRAGTTVLLAEQNAFAALAIAHRGYVLQDGRVVLAGTASALTDDPLVRRAFIGA